MKYYHRSSKQIYDYKNSVSSGSSYQQSESKLLNKCDFTFDNTSSRNYYSDTSVYTDNTNLYSFNKQSKRNLGIHKDESLDLVPSRISDTDSYKIRQDHQSKDFEQYHYECDSDNEENRKNNRNRYLKKKNEMKNRFFNDMFKSETSEHNFKHISKLKNEQVNNDSKLQQKNKIPLMVLKNKDKKKPVDSDIVYIPIVFLPDGKSEQNNSVPINLHQKTSLLNTKGGNSEEISKKDKHQMYQSVESYSPMKEQVPKQTQTAKSVAHLESQGNVKEPEVVTVYEKSYADFNMQTENESSSKDTSLKSEKPSLEMKQTEPSAESIKKQNDSTPVTYTSETDKFIKSEDIFVYPVLKASRPNITQSHALKGLKTVKSKNKHSRTSCEKPISSKPINNIYRNTKASNLTVAKTQSNYEPVFINICNKWKTKMYDIMGSHDGKNGRDIKNCHLGSLNNFQPDIKQIKNKVVLETVPDNCGKLKNNSINDSNVTLESFKKGQQIDLKENLPPTKVKVLKHKDNSDKFTNNKLITLKESIEHNSKEYKGKKDSINLPNGQYLKPGVKVIKENVSFFTSKEKTKPEVIRPTGTEPNFESELEEIIESVLKGCHVILGKTMFNMVLDGINIYAVFKEILLRELGIFKFKL